MGQPPAADHPPIAAAVVVNDGQVLLVRRRVSEGRLSWQFPAGKGEAGESADRAAVREVLEEAGVVVRSLRDLGRRVHPETGRTMIYIACEMVGGTAYAAADDEIAEVAWCDRAALATHIPYPLYGPVQQYLNDDLPEARGKSG